MDQLDASVVGGTTAVQMELLILEAQRGLVKHEALSCHRVGLRDVDRLGEVFRNFSMTRLRCRL